MEGLVEGGPCVGSQVELQNDILFRLSPLTNDIVLHKKLNTGLLGYVIHNNDKFLVARFEGNYEIIFNTIKSASTYLDDKVINNVKDNNDFINSYRKYIGHKFNKFKHSYTDKLMIYAHALWKDGSDIETVNTIVSERSLSDTFITGELFYTFGYTDETVIE